MLNSTHTLFSNTYEYAFNKCNHYGFEGFFLGFNSNNDKKNNLIIWLMEIYWTVMVIGSKSIISIWLSLISNDNGITGNIEASKKKGFINHSWENTF